jgi:opacity protein-like surface antigen
LFIEGGPAASLHLSNTVEVYNSAFSFKDTADRWDFSLIVGAGIGFKLNSTLIELEARYDYGLKNISNSSAIEINSRAIQLLAGISYLI